MVLNQKGNITTSLSQTDLNASTLRLMFSNHLSKCVLSVFFGTAKQTTFPFL